MKLNILYSSIDFSLIKTEKIEHKHIFLGINFITQNMWMQKKI